MRVPYAPTEAEAILARLRRLVTLWRATYIVQMILLLLLVLAVGLELTLPGVLAMLLRSKLWATLLIPGIAAPLLILDPVAGVVERRMGRLLHAPQTPLRRVLTVLYLVPGVMLLRRTVLVGLALMWLTIIVTFLVLWFVGLMLLTLLMRVAEPVGEAFGQAVDAVDRFLNWLYTVARQALREIALSPASRVENEEHIVLPLLTARADE
jgi:hypothetical protein